MTRSDPPKRQTGDWEWIPDDDAIQMDSDDDAEEASLEADNRIDDPDFFTAKMKAKEGRFNWNLNDIKAAKNTAPQDTQGRWCPGCGESYVTAQTMHEIERIKALRKSVARSRPVSVAAFEKAAA